MINDWLVKFKNCWIEKDIDGVMDLFADNVEYWETPFKKLNDKSDLGHEWRAIKTQDNLDLNFSVYSTDSSRHTVVWQLLYTNSESAIQNWAGVYLIELNDDGICIYFHQVGERLR